MILFLILRLIPTIAFKLSKPSQTEVQVSSSEEIIMGTRSDWGTKKEMLRRKESCMIAVIEVGEPPEY